ncbi:Exodeoxyribonuclease I [Buchnera aphidicola (Thelaxes suberi)]|uniref:exodeoxyribonuclease I n=1 Tax=Buchnera aphidicola TaxID=9 RepID=UPI0034640684
MQNKNFLFYDYETFGTNISLDKPSQFACIRTDYNFKILSKPTIVYCSLPLDYLPNPESIFITNITPQIADQKGIKEFYFAKIINQKFMKKNTCVIGFNNINFDDELTRNIFYRNLLDPYEWSYKHNNSRWDLINLLRACYILRPKGIIWPKKKTGLISFKLQDIAKENNIKHDVVHDALSDVYATMSVAKLIKTVQPKLFNFFFKLRLKHNIIDFFHKYSNLPIFYFSSIFGSNRENYSIIRLMRQYHFNSNIIIGFDLKYDINDFLQEFYHQKKNNQIIVKNLFLKGLIFIYINKCPILAPINVLHKKDMYNLNVNIDSYIKYFNKLNKYTYVFKELSKICFFKRKLYLEKNVDLLLYSDFFKENDKKIMQLIHCIKPYYFCKNTFQFQEERVKQLFFRMKARNFFSFLSENEKRKWLNYCKNHFNFSYIRQYKNNLNNIMQSNAYFLNKKNIYNAIIIYLKKKIKNFY